MSRTISIGARAVGEGRPVYIVAELSANHGQKYEEAVKLIAAAKAAGADAVKLQTYTADTLTLDSGQEWFRIKGGTPWDGRTLHELYREAFTPWDWQPKLQAEARRAGLECFSSPFDAGAVDFLEKMDIPAYKIASFELVDLPLIRRAARTGKPVIFSTGMATKPEIEEALDAFRAAGGKAAMLLVCTSAYPAKPEDMRLGRIAEYRDAFQVPVGLSDHTLTTDAVAAAVALGACLIEKHLTLSRAVPGPDAAFSLEPAEFAAMAAVARRVAQAVAAGPGPDAEEKNRAFRRSLFVVENIRRGEVFTNQNVRSIRPSNGLHPRHLEEVLGRRAAADIARGTPLRWEDVGGGRQG